MEFPSIFIDMLKYQKINKTCPICNEKFITRVGHVKEKTCCSRLCGNVFFARKKTDEEKLYIKNKTLEHYSKIPKKELKYNFVCRNCGVEFRSRTKNRICCSRKCIFSDKAYIEVHSKVQSEKISSGKHPGWASRLGKPPSYPEKFFMRVLSNNDIKYEREFSCGKYFIDFAIKDKMIALEIDGKQHEWEERKAKDLEKDSYLTDNGWKVHRIKWKSINSDNGKLYIKGEIDKFLDIYRSQVLR